MKEIQSDVGTGKNIPDGETKKLECEKFQSWKRNQIAMGSKYAYVFLCVWECDGEGGKCKVQQKDFNKICDFEKSTPIVVQIIRQESLREIS